MPRPSHPATPSLQTQWQRLLRVALFTTLALGVGMGMCGCEPAAEPEASPKEEPSTASVAPQSTGSRPVDPAATSGRPDPTTQVHSCPGKPVSFTYSSVSGHLRDGRSSTTLDGVLSADSVRVSYTSKRAGKSESSWKGTIRGPVFEAAREALSQPLTERKYPKGARRPTGGSTKSLRVRYSGDCETRGNRAMGQAFHDLLAEAARHVKGSQPTTTTTTTKNTGIRVVLTSDHASVELACEDGTRVRVRVVDGAARFAKSPPDTDCTVRLRGGEALSFGPVRTPATVLCSETDGHVSCREK